MLISPSIKHEYGHVELKQHFYFRGMLTNEKGTRTPNHKLSEQ